MIAAATLKKIATLLKIKEEDLTTAIADTKEVDVPISDTLQVLEKTELDARDANTLKEGKKDGEKEIKKVLVKEIGDKLGFKLTGDRIADLVNEVTTQINKGNDDKVSALTEQVKLLNADKTNLLKEKETLASTVEETKFENELKNYFPAERGAHLSDDKRIIMLKSDITFETVDGAKVAKKNGEIMRDPTTKNPMGLKEVVALYFTENPFLVGQPAAAGGGRGGNNNSGGAAGGAGLTKASEVLAAWKEKNPNGNEMGEGYIDHLNATAKDIPNFDYYN